MKHRILVVEDNQINSELLCQWLETEGYEVTSAQDLEGAFAEFRNHTPDAVLLDIQLGDDDGASFATWVRQQQSAVQHIPVIAVTAHAMATERQRILEAGCTACVSKPIDFKMLQDQLDGWLAISTERPKVTDVRPDAREPKGQ
jgi:CheY-like chemotaxis protein